MDIEFAHDGRRFHLLQCRPQAQTAEAVSAVIPRGLPEKDVLFSAHRHVSNGWVPDITHVVWVVPEAYAALPDPAAMREVGRAVGRLNRLLPKRRFILMGPGRWGSRGDVKLGVSVTYADINNTAMLIEIARRSGDYVPDLSFGTHFFQDLVEARIRYLPLYPDETGVGVQRGRSCWRRRTCCRRLLPDHADLAGCLRVIDVPAATGGRILRVHLNADLDEALAAFEEPDDDRPVPHEQGRQVQHEPRQYWRWRFRMAERMVRALDPAEYGVVAVYLYGSVKNGTAGPGSDIDLLVHVRADCRREKLEGWFEGWSRALGEMNFSRTGVTVPRLLDVTILTDEEIARGDGVAARINAPTDAARRLAFS